MSLAYNKKFVRIEKDFPRDKGSIYVIQFIGEGSIYHEADERSRTHPGHGYPAYTETYTKIEQYVTSDKEAWEEAIKEHLNEKGMVAFVAHVPSVTTKVDIKIDL